MDYRHSAEWKQVRKAFLARQRSKHGRYVPCSVCGSDVDLNYGGREPMSVSVDHVEAISLRPDLRASHANLRVAHLVCNQHKGNRTATVAGEGISLARATDVAVDWYGRIEHRDGCECHLSPHLNRSACW